MLRTRSIYIRWLQKGIYQLCSPLRSLSCPMASTRRHANIDKITTQITADFPDRLKFSTNSLRSMHYKTERIVLGGWGVSQPKPAACALSAVN